MNFKELKKHKTSIGKFSLNWRFDSLSKNEYSDFIENLIILNNKGCKIVKSYLDEWELHTSFPFKQGLFVKNEHFSFSDKENKEVIAYLDSFGFSDDLQVLLSWDNETSVLTKWKNVINHWTDFFYPSSDDLTIVGELDGWAILFHHSEIVYYSTNYLSQLEYSNLLKDCLKSNFELINWNEKSQEDFSIDFEIENPSKELRLWISSMNKEISIGFEDKKGTTNWHAHMSSLGANFPKEQLDIMIKIVNKIISGNEKIVCNSKNGYYLTYNIEKDKIDEENNDLILKNWKEI